MAGLHKSDLPNPVINWIDSRLPIFTMLQKRSEEHTSELQSH